MQLKTSEYRLAENFLSKKRFSHSGIITAVMLALCILASRYYWQFEGLDNRPLAANTVWVFESGEYWRLFSTLFVHGDPGHLLSNSLMFALMGFFVHRHYGPWVFPTLCLVMGALINIIVLHSMRSGIYIVGISGVVYYLWGFWLILYICIQRHIGLNRRLMKVVAISLMILVPSSYDPQVSYLSHGVGLLFGIITGSLYFLVRKSFIRSFEKWEPVEPWHDGFYDELEDELNEIDDEERMLH